VARGEFCANVDHPVGEVTVGECVARWFELMPVLYPITVPAQAIGSIAARCG
jgi:hypothetical protein